jgi:hypothetical protein
MAATFFNGLFAAMLQNELAVKWGRKVRINIA